MGSEPAPVLTSVGYLLLKAGVHMHAVFDESLSALGLTGREFLVLSFVRSEEGLSQQDLSRRLGLDPTIIVGLVDSLEDRALVSRARDPSDRRRYLLSLTSAGDDLQRRAEAAARRAEAEFLDGLGDAERSRLRALLHEVMRHRLPWLP